jgi:hypothetical protein
VNFFIIYKKEIAFKMSSKGVFKVKNINDLELLYTVLRAEYPKVQIELMYNFNNKEYTVTLTDKPYEADPKVPVDLSIQVVYGDSVTGDTPLLLRHPITKTVFVKSIDNLCNEWSEYEEFKIFDQSVRLEKQYGLCNYQVWCDAGWTPIKKVIRHKTNKKIYRVCTTTGIVDVTEDHSLIQNNGVKIKGSDLKVGDALLQSFPKTFDNNADMNFQASVGKPKTMAQQIFYLERRSGNNISVRCTEDKERGDIYYISPNREGRNENENAVVRIVDLGTCGSNFVYDLETECGRFNAGIGEIVVSNTDSIFVKFKYNLDDFKANRLDTFRLASLCGEKLTNEVFKRPPVEMEFEKVFQPFILLTKKRYIGKKFEDTRDPFKLKGVDAKGIALTRRDYCALVKKCYKEVIDTIFSDNVEHSKNASVVAAVDVLKKYIDQIDGYKVPLEDLVVSAMLAKSYKSDNLPHVNLAKKLKERHMEVQVGDRIPYIFVEDNAKGSKKYELAEDPKWAEEHKLRYNRTCYLEQLAKPLLSFMKIVLREHEDMLDDIIKYVNDRLVSYGSKPLRPSDFKDVI